MTRNLLPIICTAIGLSINKPFKIKDQFGDYSIGEDGVLYKVCKGTRRPTSEISTMDLVTGKIQFISPPPEIGTPYLSFGTALDGNWEIREYKWLGTPDDYARFRVGWVYYTRLDAVDAIDEIAGECNARWV